MRIADTCLIRLTRRNKLAQYLSMVRAEQSGVWFSNEDQQSDSIKTWLYPRQCQKAFDQLRAADRFLVDITAKRLTLAISYEDFNLDASNSFERVQHHVGLPIPPIRPMLRKQRRTTLPE
ncbi:MAG: Stf0 family sulfotransferase [Methylococcales bacterium]